ncbi:H(+)/Cl(-) exchange transporter 6-like isoform X2 [Mercenaria mercenaria]|uniref:H(+)/Cl(-) exchange transporter 6-like isoform X2 n=1 Tax=Mercenaria mercenaria TaxID=6596 RepID=UPI001E1D3188|nr:H(+)/Cl(-) exchange transporter 6-like isoform X2 [Mercenaria mercenaria]
MANEYIRMDQENTAMDGDVTPTVRGSSTTVTNRMKKVLGKSGTMNDQPSDDSTRYHTDDEYSFLAAGRDYESMNTTHKYTDQERLTLAAYESLDYLPSHNDIYKKWIKHQRISSYQLDVWALMGFIGFTIGVIGFLLHQLIEKIADVKWEITQKYIEDGEFSLACLFATGYSVAFIIFSAGIVIYLRPCAGGSGIPEITGFLNGTNVRHIFNIKTMVVKFFSCVTCVGCGLPVGPEGPMIHLGALVGAGLSQFRSETLGIKLPILEKFRTSEARRNFISAGAAAGVASAFGAPVGGLLFSMEEVSSFWTVTLSWQIFFCCIVSTFTTDLFNSAFMDFDYTGSFGKFKTNRYILFEIDQGVDVNIVMFLPTLIIGIIGGLLGAAFTILNLKITRFRKTVLYKVKRDWAQKLIKLLEPCLIMVIVTIFSILIPAAFTCTQFTCIEGQTGDAVKGCFNDTRNALHVDEYVIRYTCPQGTIWRSSNTTVLTNGTYNEVASLLFGTLEDAVTFLFSRDTHLEFNYPALFSVLPFYFIAVSWACSTAVACGALVPMLMVGAIYGRIVGRLMVSMFGLHQTGYWEWMDPGAFALIGAASFFGGVTRLTLATTVIMMELTNDVQVLLPVMVSVMVAKWVGDFFTHPIYHALLELKCIPFLDPEPRVTIDKKMVNLELFQAADIMSHPVVTVQTHEHVQTLAQLMTDSSHGGFPVIKKGGSDDEEHFYGMITRLELTVIMMNEDLFFPAAEINDHYSSPDDPSWIEFDQLNIHKVQNPEEISDKLFKYLHDSKYKDLVIDLNPYINQSALAIPEKFSLKRTYVIFRTLGLRHLTVIDNNNIVKGIITRKDLMGFSLQERLTNRLILNHTLNGRVEMTPVASDSNFV